MTSNGLSSAPSTLHDERQDVDAEDLLAELENEDDSTYRAQRMQELHAENAGSRPAHATATLDASYLSLGSDDEVLQFTTEHERAVVHFFHNDFARCSTMDDHCRQIAEKHAEYGDADVTFGRVDVKNASFVVEKLGVRILPCVIGFVRGVAKGRVTGFEGLCWDGKEGSILVTKALEETFVEWTVLRKRLVLDDVDSASEEEEQSKHDRSSRRGIQGRNQQIADEGDDWD